PKPPASPAASSPTRSSATRPATGTPPSACARPARCGMRVLRSRSPSGSRTGCGAARPRRTGVRLRMAGRGGSTSRAACVRRAVRCRRITRTSRTGSSRARRAPGRSRRSCWPSGGPAWRPSTRRAGRRRATACTGGSGSGRASCVCRRCGGSRLRRVVRGRGGGSSGRVALPAAPGPPRRCGALLRAYSRSPSPPNPTTAAAPVPGRPNPGDPMTTETAYELLHRHGLPEDVIDGALALHAQQLADLQRLRMDELDLTGQKARIVGRIVDLIDPTKTAAVSSAVVAPPTDQTALRDRIAEALMRWTERGNSPQYAAMRRPETVQANAYSRADAVLAVLPTTDRAAVL